MNITAAASEGNLERIKFIVEQSEIYPSDRIQQKAVVIASANGYLDVVKYLLEKTRGSLREFVDKCECTTEPCLCNFITRAFLEASEKGHLPIVQYLLDEHGLTRVSSYRINYIRGGELKTLRSVDFHDVAGQGFILAAKNGHLSIIQYLVQRKFEKVNITRSTGYAALAASLERGHDHVVDFLLERPDGGHKVVPNSSCARIALEIDNLDLIKRLVAHGMVIKKDDDYLFRVAIEKNSIETIKYLVEVHGCFYKLAAFDAACFRRWDVMKFFIDKGMDGDKESTIAHAAKSGDLDLVMYLLDKGYPTHCPVLPRWYWWCSRSPIEEYGLLMNAATHGHVDFVMFFINNPAVFNVGAIDHEVLYKCLKYAVPSGFVNVVSYLCDLIGESLNLYVIQDELHRLEMNINVHPYEYSRRIGHDEMEADKAQIRATVKYIKDKMLETGTVFKRVCANANVLRIQRVVKAVARFAGLIR